MEHLSPDEFDVIIRRKSRWFELNLREVWQYRDLIYLYVKRAFQIRYKQTVLGPAWQFLSPFISTVIYAFVFSDIAGISTDGIPTMLFYLGGITLWNFFSGTLQNTATTFTANARLFSKVYFPRLTVPVAAMFSAAVNFGIQMLMFLGFWIYYIAVGKIQPNYAALPLVFPILLQMGCLATGLGLIFSSITAKYRDLSVLISFGIQLWMYVTPVVYPISAVEIPWIRDAILCNPAACGVETFRYIFVGTGMVSIFWWSIATVITLLALLAGIVLFNRIEKNFMDTV